MTRAAYPPHCLKQADALRKESRWKEAVERYLEAERLLPTDAGIKHNIGLCHLALNDPENALRYADLAILLNAGLWQSHLLKAKSLNQSGQKERAIALLAKIIHGFPSCSEARLELASLAMDELGDAALAAKLARSIRDDPRHVHNARLTELMASLYESGKDAEELSESLRGFAGAHLARPGIVLADGPRHMPARRRIGLISPQFCCSPVYFFCIGALRNIAQQFDLVILNRGTREDWASSQFKSLAREWHDVANLNRDALAAFIARQGLHTLIDLGGWMDPVALSAISAKPAKRLYKWVGGQSATTGLRAFDGFFTDRHQSLPEHQMLYAEPLIFLKRGYVTYTPPPYMPAPSAADHGEVFGVIANPVKVSRKFLAYLKDALESYVSVNRDTVILRFVDRRYCHAQLRARIETALHTDAPAMQERVRIEFVVPQDHREYLQQIGKLTAVIDTFPYTGGLTTIESLSLGVPCITRPGRLFSQRHSYAHCIYAGLVPRRADEQKNLPGMLHFYHRNSGTGEDRTSLVGRASDRLDHDALAESISAYL